MNELKTASITLEDLVQKGRLYLPNTNEFERKKTLSYLSAFLDVVKSNITEVKKVIESDDSKSEFDINSYIRAKIGILYSKLNEQIDKLIHHPSFTNLEGKWRGLDHLIKNVEVGKALYVKVLCVTEDELSKDLIKAADFDQSKLFKKIYEQEIGTLGGVPFSVIVYDHYFNPSNHSVEVMDKLTSVCAAAHAPCIAGVDPSVFNLEDFRKINQARDIGKIFQTNARVAWNAFRSKEDSRYMTLVLPRVMVRAPYSVENNPASGILYNETVDYNDQNNFVWMNAGYALVVRIATAFSTYGWTAAIRGLEGGGCASDLPVFLYTKKEGDLALKCPTEVSITDRREKELSDLGFAPLCHCKGTNLAVFFSVQTCQMPVVYENQNASANARMSSSLTYVLIASRFAHYVKVMMRNKIGSFQTVDDIEFYLKNWISQYILMNVTASQELKARMPLKAADIKVVEAKGTVGVYNAIIWISPHLQLDEMSVSIRLVSRLPTAS